MDNMSSASKPRRIAFRVASTLFGLLCLFLTIGSLLNVAAGGGPVPGGQVLFLGHGAWLGGVLAAGFLLPLWRPTQRVAGWQQIALSVLALVIGAVTLGVVDPLFEIGFPIALLITGLLHPGRGWLFRRGDGISPILAPLALLSAVPAVVYFLAVNQTAAGVSDPDVMQGLQAAGLSVLAIPLTGLLAAARTAGWQIPLWCTAILAAAFGIGSLLYPVGVGSFGTGWGAVAVLGAVLFVAVGEWETRRHRAGLPDAAVARV